MADSIFSPVAGQRAYNPRTFETVLTDQEQERFNLWKSLNASHDSGADYDLRGAYVAGVKPDPVTGHWPDTFKKPNHPTFSNQSQYYWHAPERAGRWTEQGEFIPPTNLYQTQPAQPPQPEGAFSWLERLSGMKLFGK